MTRSFSTIFAAMLLAGAAPLAAADTPAASTGLAGTTKLDGLLPVHVDRKGGRIILSLPAPGADNVSTRLLYTTALRTGLGSAPIGLDRAQPGPAQIVAFRRLGKKVAIELENPRFRATRSRPRRCGWAT